MLQFINGLPEIPDFIAKEGSGRFDVDLAEKIGRYNPIRWRPRRRIRDQFSTGTPSINAIPFRPEMLEPRCFRSQRELVLFFNYMTTAVAAYTDRYGLCVLPHEYHSDLFSRYAVLLNYLEQRTGRRFESPAPEEFSKNGAC